MDNVTIILLVVAFLIGAIGVAILKFRSDRSAPEREVVEDWPTVQIAGGAGSTAVAPSDPYFTQPHKVVEVVSGNAIRILDPGEAHGQTTLVVLANVDYYTGGRGTVPTKLHKDEAHKLAREHLDGTFVWLKKEPKAKKCDPGTIFAYVFANEDDEVDYGEFAIRQGLLKPHSYGYSYARERRYNAAQAEARKWGYGYFGGN